MPKRPSSGCRLLCCAVALVGPVASACGGECKSYGTLGLIVSVTADGNQPICDAVVVAVAGDYSETLMPLGPTATRVYEGAPDRKGTYTVTVERQGRTTKVGGLKEVRADDCGHVKPVRTTISLGA